MRVVDLFCGAGGFSEGFHRAGYEIVRAYDIWAPAVLTHNMNHSNGREIALKGDILKIAWANDEEFEKAIPDSEVIIGSPPCIAFSNSNKSGKADKESGINLIVAFLRIVARKKFKKNSKLKYWVMENVGNSEKYVKDFYTMEDLDLVGLTNQSLEVKGNSSKLYNMKYYGVPTNRIRYICGDFPKVEQTILDNEVVSLGGILNTLGKPSPKSYKEIKEKISDPNYGFEILSSELSDHHYISEIPEFEWKKAKRHKTDKGYMGKMAFPENKDKPARTIMATLSRSARESMIFPLENLSQRYRVPTIREVATLMSFPIDFKFYGENESVKYRMVGNAVTPKFSYELAKAIILNHNVNFPDMPWELEDKFKVRKEFPENPPFLDLNGTSFSIKEEKERKIDAKYKYHVPYLVEKSFRVELTNISDDDSNKIKWNVAIHRSQGKSAEVYEEIKLSEKFFNMNTLNEIQKFYQEIILKVDSAEELQRNYCKTTIQRKGLIGPDELLQEVREFVDFYSGSSIEIEGISRPVPYKIILAYFVLNKIIKELNYEKEYTGRKIAN